tara:strand:- start:659 stop:793 length:135 start_codon:yes stop_codon:yes gene_type:complete
MVIHLVTPNQGLEDRKISLIKKNQREAIASFKHLYTNKPMQLNH